jgi:transposase InsO family protein
VGVTRSVYYEHKYHVPSDREIRRLLLTPLVLDIHQRSRGTYGMIRIAQALRKEHDMVVNKKLVLSIMRELGIHGLPGPKKHKKNLVNAPTEEDLVQRNFSADRPDALWLTDITEHHTSEGKVYCCAVLDLFSRKIVGWAIDRRCESALVNDALAMARDSRSPGSSTIIHSDHGAQGEFNRPSQHLDHGGVKWRRCESDNVKFSFIEDRFHRRVVRRWPGERIGSDSGQQSRAVPRLKRPASRPVCLARWGSAGSATLEG